jgi:hypothetical protein
VTRVLGFAAGLSFILTLLALVVAAGYEDPGGVFWAVVGLMAVITVGLAVAAIASAATPSGAGRSLVPFVVCAVAVSPAVGVYLALWVFDDDNGAFWVVLLAVPALLTAVAGLLTRRRWVGIAVGAVASAGLSFAVLFALIVYAASQGAFD